MNEPYQHKYWYVRSKGVITGPFSSGVVRRHVLLGKINKSDDLSHDQHVWKRLVQLKELIPPVLNIDPQNPITSQRLAAARRWASDDGEQGDLSRGMKNISADTSNNDPLNDKQLGSTITKKIDAIKREKIKNNLFTLLIFILLVITIGYYIILTEPRTYEPINCELKEEPGLVYNYCLFQGLVFEGKNIENISLENANLSGANISYSNLKGSKLSYSNMTSIVAIATNFESSVLIGVNLRNSNLNNANFINSNLSYADLSAANIQDTDFTNANLSNTRWINGEICLPGSVGVCIFKPLSAR